MKELKTILPANRRVQTLLGKARDGEGELIWTSFLVRLPVEAGLLLHNTLTLELVLVPAELVSALEAPTGELRDWLHRHWFLIPGDLDEHALARELRQTLRLMDPPPSRLEKYTVFTTTACNARCFYCYEQKWGPRTMSLETADRVADYMIAHSAGGSFQIVWFGGEPLVNMRVIERISQRLTEAGADFWSSMVTNAYLFDPEVIARAVSFWRLRQINVTLDGVGETYDRIKDFKGVESGAFERVVGNIRRLSEAGVRVTIRMNYDLHNLEEIQRLTDWLAEHMAGLPGVAAYPVALSEDPDDPALQRTPEVRELLCRQEALLRRKLETAGLFHPLRLPRSLETHMCMADSGSMITILPEGQIGLCESYDREGVVGSVDSPELDQAAVSKTLELRAEIPECADCPLYPDCIRLKICPNQICHPQRRDARIERKKRSMTVEWERYLLRKARAEQGPVSG